MDGRFFQYGRACVTALIVCALCSTAFGQDAAMRERLARLVGDDATPLVSPDAPGETFAERMYVDLGLSLREAYFNVNNADGTSSRLWQTQGEVYGHVSYAGAHQGYVRLNFDYRDYGEGDVFSDAQGQGQLAEPILAALWYRFDLAAARRLAGETSGEGNFRLTIGRQRALLGSGLVFDDDLDGVTADITSGKMGAMIFAGLTPKRSTVDFDGSRPDFDISTRRIFFGAQVRFEKNAAFQPYVFAMAQIDDNDRREAILDVGGTAVPTRFRYDSNYFGAGASGAIDESWVWSIEGMYEWGRSASNPFDFGTGALARQTINDISAWAGAASLTYLFNDVHNSKAHLWVMAGSGDADRRSGNQTLGGNARNTKDSAFNAFGYVPTGYVLAPDLANLLVVRAGGSTHIGSTLESRLRVGVDGYLYTKINARGGATIETERGERFVGGAVDLFARWQFAPDLSLDVRYGVFLAGDAIPKEHNDIHHLIYVGVTYAF